MLELLKIIDGKIPEWIDFFISTATKQGMQAAINCETFLALGEVYRRECFRYPVVICGADATRPNEIVFFDLSFDPEEIFSLETSDIFSMVHKGGRDGPLKKYKINITKNKDSFSILRHSKIFSIQDFIFNRLIT